MLPHLYHKHCPYLTPELRMFTNFHISMSFTYTQLTQRRISLLNILHSTLQFIRNTLAGLQEILLKQHSLWNLHRIIPISQTCQQKEKVCAKRASLCYSSAHQLFLVQAALSVHSKQWIFRDRLLRQSSLCHYASTVSCFKFLFQYFIFATIFEGAPKCCSLHLTSVTPFATFPCYFSTKISFVA